MQRKKKDHTTREAWLIEAVDLLRPLFAEHDLKVPAKVRVACGWPGGGSINRRIGECWDAKCSADKSVEMFISPRLSKVLEPQGVLATLVHEMVHAVVGNKAGHKGPFREAAKGVGLEGKMTATCAGDDLIETLTPIAEALGPYPHSMLTPSKQLKKKANCRLLKAQCPKCGYVVRVTRKWLDEAGAPICPTCEIPFIEEKPKE